MLVTDHYSARHIIADRSMIVLIVLTNGQMLSATEPWYRKFFIQSLEEELQPYGLTAYDEIEITTQTQQGSRQRFPDVVIVDPKVVTESHGLIFARKDGIKAVIETKHPKKLVDAGLFQAIQYMNQIQCKFGFATNFKEIIAVTLGDKPTIDKERLGRDSDRQTIKNIAGVIAAIVSGKRSLTIVEQNDTAIVDILRGAVAEIQEYTKMINPDILEAPLGFLLVKSFDRKLTTNERNAAIKQAAAYLVINQIVFYNLLSAETGWFERLHRIETTEQLQQQFDKVPKERNWKPVFQSRLAPLLDDGSVEPINRIIEAVTHLKLERVKHDILGKIFHELIPFEIRKRIAAYYTSNSAADLLARLAVRDWKDKVLDPSCGSGTLLVSTYTRKRELAPFGESSPAVIHKKLLKTIYGIDITPFAAHLAVVHLSLQELLADSDDVKVTINDAFAIKPHGSVEFLGGKILKTKMTTDGVKSTSFEIPVVDLVIQNPPFTRGEKLEDQYKTFLEKNMGHVQPKYIGKARVGLHCYFIVHAADFLGKQGKYAAVLPESVFVADYAKGIRRFILDTFVIEYFITSQAKTTFSEGCDFKEVLFVARKKSLLDKSDWTAKFVVLKQDLSLSNTRDIAERILSSNDSCRNEMYEINLVTRKELLNERNWMTFTRPRDLNRIVDIVKESKNITQGKKVMIPSEGMHLDSQYFFVPNGDWNIVQTQEKSLAIKNTTTGETVTMPMEYLHLSLRRPEFHTVITPRLEHYMLLIPPKPKDELTSDLKRYIEWAELKGAHKKKTIADYSKRKGIPWYSYMYDQVHFARTKAKGRIAFVLKFRLKRRACIAHFFDFNVLGTNSYFFGSMKDPIYDKVLVAWFNSTLFLTLFLQSRREIAGDWGQIKIRDLGEMPCINPSSLKRSAIDEIATVLDRMRTVQLPPIPDQVGEPMRRELDLAMIKALEIPDPDIFLRLLYSSFTNQITKLY